jgi:hypothetical protein
MSLILNKRLSNINESLLNGLVVSSIAATISGEFHDVNFWLLALISAPFFAVVHEKFASYRTAIEAYGFMIRFAILFVLFLMVITLSPKLEMRIFLMCVWAFLAGNAIVVLSSWLIRKLSKG